MQENRSQKKNQIPLLLLFLFAVFLSLICVTSATLLAISAGAQDEIEASMLAQSSANYQRDQDQATFGQLSPNIILEATRDGSNLYITPSPNSLGDALQNFASTAVAQIFPTAKPTLLPTPKISTIEPEATETAVSVVSNTATPLPTPTNSVTPAFTTTPTNTPTVATSTPTAIATSQPTHTVTPAPTATNPPVNTPAPPPPAATNTPIPTATPTFTPQPTQTHTAVPTATATATATVLPTETPTATPTATATATHTPVPFDIFFDDFESDQGWITNPNGSDNATTGHWERTDPEQTTFDGVIHQQGTTVSGSFDLVTAGIAGSATGPDIGTHDVDDGTTSIRSPNIVLPSSGNLTLSFSYYLSHYSNSSSNDYFRVSIVGSTTAVVLEELGASDVDAAVWDSFNTSLNSFAGQTIYILIEARDGGAGSLVEAAVDDVLIRSN